MADLVTLQEVKEYVGIKSGVTSSDRRIQQLIGGCSAAVEQIIFKEGFYGTFTGIVEKQTAEQFTNIIYVGKPKFDSVSSVKEGTSVLIADEDYFLFPDIGAIKRVGISFWSIEDLDIEITYTWSNPAPEDVKIAVKEYVAILSNLKTKTLLTSEGIQDTVTQGMPELVKSMLKGRKVLRAAMPGGNIA